MGDSMTSSTIPENSGVVVVVVVVVVTSFVDSLIPSAGVKVTKG